jgi:hypothetical protein
VIVHPDMQARVPAELCRSSRPSRTKALRG